MDNLIGKWLLDIRNSILEIESFFEGKEKKFEEYRKNTLLKRGVERNFEIIGEAVDRILKKDESIEISNARQIVQFRNLIIHAYDSISDENVWAVVINHLPKLKIEIDNLLKNYPELPFFE